MRELLTADAMQAVDQQAIDAGIDSYGLMQAAGRAVALQVRRRVGRRASVLVLAGGGKNGGDGAVATSALLEAGYRVRLLSLLPCGDDADTRRAFAELADLADCENVSALDRQLGQADLIVDALFGAGLSRPVTGELGTAIDRINRAEAQVLSVDLPSGIDGNTGRVLGRAVVADDTVTFFRYKLGHLLYPGRAHCGRLALADIGIPASLLENDSSSCFLNDPAEWGRALSGPTGETHKYRRGHVLVRAGASGKGGAARLAASAAHRLGAGLVTVASATQARGEHAARLDAIMLAEADDVAAWQCLLEDERINACVIGPGNGVNADTRSAVLAALEQTRSVVLDADALSVWAADADQLFRAVTDASQRGCEVVLTPHEGEFQRLFGSRVATERGKVEQARTAATLSGAIVVLKGPDTVVAAPAGRTVVNANAPPWLATAGAGDVLAGGIAGLQAQGMNGFAAACAGVWIHGEAARSCRYPMRAEDLLRALPATMSACAPVVRLPLPLG